MAPFASLRISLHQINPTVGDLAGNEDLIARGLDAAQRAGSRLAVFPELAVTGYPPEDLLHRESFLRDAAQVVGRLASRCDDLVAVVGYPERAEDVYNAAAVLAQGRVLGVHRKMRLPNYGVFDEQRYFSFGSLATVLDVDGTRVGLTVCEDLWEPGPPATDQATAGATLIVNLSASPYHAGKGAEREMMVAQRARDTLTTIALCNLVGGQDELVFDGHSFVVDHTGTTIARAASFSEEMLVIDVDPTAGAAARLRDARHRAGPPAPSPRVTGLGPIELTSPPPPPAEPPPLAPPPVSTEAEVYDALALGLHDYTIKNGFDHVVLGLSGGVDSALVACVAVDALGPERVSVVVMPSPHSSPDTQQDAREMARRLRVNCLELGIGPTMETYEQLLAEVFAGREPDLTEENLQARMRGNLLMALSNKFGWLVLTTGNKSEMSVGYSTLYGDSAGGFAVIKDCPKTLVYRLVEHRLMMAVAAGEPEPIPRSIVDRAPSAELRPDQRDDDTLPPYELLDRILEGYVERDLDRDQLVAQGCDREVVDRVMRLVDLAEYKRRQAPPGVKITPKAFGRDRRLPITNRYRG